MRHASAVQAQPVTNAFTLGRASSLSDPVARGEVGEIRRLELETDRGTFAIKQEFKSSSVDEVETSTAYQRACWEAGIPTPEPLRALTGGFTAQVDRRQVRLTSTPSWRRSADPSSRAIAAVSNQVSVEKRPRCSVDLDDLDLAAYEA